MWLFLTVLFLCAFYVWRIEPLLKPKSTQPSEPIPTDLLAYAQGFDTEWARDQALDRCHELFVKLGSWNQVRHALQASDKGLSVIEVVE